MYCVIRERHINLKIGKEVTNLKSRQVHVGEQNIVDNKTYFDKEKKKIVHEVVIEDGNIAPYCTIEALRDHIGEMESAKDMELTPFKTNEEKVSEIATETLALRIGDVSRDSGPDAKTQSRKEVHVERSRMNNEGRKQLENYLIDERGKHINPKAGIEVK